jgi:hypothetical protein
MASKDTVIYIASEEDLPYDPSRPEKELLRAILQNALLDMNKPGEVGRKAKEYFLNPDEDYVFSFRSVCSYLNISPRRILVAAGLRDPEPGMAAPRKNLAVSLKTGLTN